MEFNRLLQNYESEGQKEIVALAIFYLEEYEEQQEVASSDIRRVIKDSRSTISTSSISSYLQRLDNWIADTSNGDYQLSHVGQEEVKSRLREDILNEPRDDLFLNTTDLNENEYYERLIQDINKCYQHHIPDAALVLSRKLFEHLVYNILQGHYGGRNNEIFLNTDENRPLAFKALIENLRDAQTTLHQYSRDLDDEVIDAVEELRQEGNSGAHSIRVDITEEDLEELSSELTRAAEILFDVYMKIQIRHRKEG